MKGRSYAKKGKAKGRNRYDVLCIETLYARFLKIKLTENP
jgi:hypothetical protein